MNRDTDDWEELARRAPYFAVLTDPRYRAMDAPGRAAFFRSGEEDVDRILRQVALMLQAPFVPKRALDFGCGVGRLTIAMAGRAECVTGCDVAPTMLRHARENAAGLTNVEFIESSALGEAGTFDFICSLLVFQHIPPAEGLRLLELLLQRLAPGGVAAIHLTFRRPGGSFRRAARTLRASSKMVHRLASLLRREDPSLPYMQMNVYDRTKVAAQIARAGGREIGAIPTRDGDTEGAIVIIAR